MIRVHILAFVILCLPGLAFAQIEIEEVTSPGGLKAWLVNAPSIPFIAFQIAFRGGTSLDPADKGGATNLMVGLLEEGTKDMDAAAFLRASESLAANFGFNAGRDEIRISAQVLKSNGVEALALLRRALIEPAFNEIAIGRIREQVISGIERDLKTPRAIARARMNKIAFGEHPYSRPSDGTVQSVQSLSRDDLVVIHKSAMSRDHLAIGVVGDVNAEDLGVMLDALLGDLPAKGAELPGAIEFSAPGGTTVVPFDTPQSVAIWAQPIDVDLSHPDFAPIYIMNHILGGGGFGSRLTEEVREKRGLTYGVQSYIAWLASTEYIGGGLASANETIAQAIDVVRSEWSRMGQDGVTGEELEMAKKYLTGSYALRFDGNAKIARMLVGLQLDGFAIDYINTRNERLNGVRLEDIARVAKSALMPEDLHFVVVGKPEGVETTR